MATSLFADAVKEFETAIYETERYLDFVVMGNNLRPWLGKMVDWNNLRAESKKSLQDFIGHKDYHVEVGYNGLIVGISAAFEHLVRRLVREGVAWLNKKYDHYDKLPESLRHQNLIRSGYALSTVAEPPAEMDYDYESLCRNLATCHKDGGVLVLNAEPFSAGVAAISQQRIKESIGRLGVEINWDVFGTDQGLSNHFKTKVGRKTRDEIELYLKTFVHLRNKLAHSGHGVQVTEAQVHTALAFFSKFGPLFAEAMEEELKKANK